MSAGPLSANCPDARAASLGRGAAGLGGAALFQEKIHLKEKPGVRVGSAL